MSNLPFIRNFRLFLRKTFDIHEGEQRRAMLMQLNIFLIISTLLIVKPTVNGLFLSIFGVEQLPIAFLLVAVAAAIVSGFYSRLVSRIPLKRAMISTLYGSVVCLIVFGLFLHFDIWVSLTLYLFYIFVAIFALLTTSQFWVLANIVFNAREAKRLFGFIGAGAIAGGIFGGYLTSILAQVVSSEILPLVAAVFLFICIPVTNSIWRKEVMPDKLDEHEKQSRSKRFTHPFVQIKQSKHLTYISAIVGVSVIVAKFVDYQFGGIAASLIPDRDELTAFFGFWFSTFSVISLLMQLFVTRRVVTFFGVVYTLFFLPLSILLATILLTIMPELLMAAVFLKMADGGLKQSVNKAAMELLILPIPQVVKNRTKTFIDVFVDSLAAGISGLILLFLVQGLNLSALSINAIIIFFIGIWLYLIYKVRREYFDSFRKKIVNVKKKRRKARTTILEAEEIAGMKKALKEGDEHQIMHILQMIKKTPNDLFLEVLKPLVYHNSEEVRAEAIRNLYQYPRHNCSYLISPLSSDSSYIVKMAALDYLLKLGSEEQALVQSYIHHPNYKVRFATLVSLARELSKDHRSKSIYGLEQLIVQALEEVKQMDIREQQEYCTIRIIAAIGCSGLKTLYDYLASFLQSENHNLVIESIKAVGFTRHPRFLDDLIIMLAHDTLRDHARNALLQYGKGIVGILAKTAENADANFNVIRYIPSVVKQVDSQRSVDLLFKLFDYPDFMVRREALRGLNLLHNSFPHLAFNKKSVLHRILNEAKMFQESLSVLYAESRLYLKEQKVGSKPAELDEITKARAVLIRLLERRLDRNLERIFRLLGLKYTSEDIVTIYKGLQNKNRDLRLNAIEFLDNLLEPGLKKILIPIIETTMMETISRDTMNSLKLEVPSEIECLRILLNSHDFKIKQAVLFLISMLPNVEYIPLLEKYRNECIDRLIPFVDQALVSLRERKEEIISVNQ
ncbi:MAG: hypothetical protein KJP00_01065 [Bacteroidia bacterium]|nr:hypothetical protein [Bacteroidia bacterium]